ncbi:MAG: glycosyltransferase [Prevotella sp.]|nr:glycosyltransferase [Prevotella sp.]
MKVLWFEVTPPAKYLGQGWVIGGWQDSLERIVRQIPEIELSIAFEVTGIQPAPQTINDVKYYPIALQYTKKEKEISEISWNIHAEKLLPELKKIVEEVKPDLIHVFGTEWPFGLIAETITIPVVIHIQGAIAPYNNAMFPPGYNLWDILGTIGWTHLSRIKKRYKEYKLDKSRLEIEMRAWKAVAHYMGRTHWDEALSEIMHPNRKYYHVEEALRTDFTTTGEKWNIPSRDSILLVSTGCSNFWKGPDMLLKTAKILTELGIDFEWYVAGMMPKDVKQTVEKKVGVRFAQCNVKFTGFLQPQKLSELLVNSTMYVHTAYVENSPNSICEAQCLGVPIVSTNVGGIASLVKHGEQGLLVPANDPWQMAYAIIKLSKDKDLMIQFSNNSRECARKRHDDHSIKEQILKTYYSIVKQTNDTVYR